MRIEHRVRTRNGPYTEVKGEHHYQYYLSWSFAYTSNPTDDARQLWI